MLTNCGPVIVITGYDAVTILDTKSGLFFLQPTETATMAAMTMIIFFISLLF
jgi:hypothetical protein